MSRLAACFESLRSNNKKALIPYITAGDPSPVMTVGLMHTLVESGADILELGVPFSDPMADGPVIQAACERALIHHVTLSDVLDLVKEFRQQNTTTPVVLMGYLNPHEIMGYENFSRRAREVGVDGVLTVDLPPEEAGPLVQALLSNDIDPVFLIAPTSTEERIKKICHQARGFVYYVSLKGVTGASNLDISAVSDKLDIIRKFTSLPVGVGFGIKDADTAAKVALVADAVVVGSALVRCIADNAEDEKAIQASIGQLLRTMREAMDGCIQNRKGQRATPEYIR